MPTMELTNLSFFISVMKSPSRWRTLADMKPNKGTTDEYATFEKALKNVLAVSHSELKAKIDAEKRKRTKRLSLARASKPKA